MNGILCINSVGTTGATCKLECAKVFFTSDKQNQAIGKFDANINAFQKTLWFANMPRVTFKGPGPYYIHRVYLKTAWGIEDKVKNAIWCWNSDPFATAPTSEDFGGRRLVYTVYRLNIDSIFPRLAIASKNVTYFLVNYFAVLRSWE